MFVWFLSMFGAGRVMRGVRLGKTYRSGKSEIMKRVLAFALIAIGSQAIVFAQDLDTCASFNQQVKSTYNFKPSRITDSERDAKAAAMDRFWETVRARSNKFLTCLRASLQDSSADKWFRFDASNLLVEVDPSSASKIIQIQSYAEVDLDDVELRFWVTVLAQRGLEGFDVSEAASRWLAYPKAGYLLPEHGGYEINALQGALFIFGSMDESQADTGFVETHISSESSRTRTCSLDSHGSSYS